MLEDWPETSSLPARQLYACASTLSTHRITRLNIATPTFTRAPGEASGNFALECAMDELAHALKVDPLELRLRNYAEQDQSKGRPYSSKSLRECYRLGAEHFGWQRRASVPGTMRDGRWRIGWGVATATYPANRSAAEAMVRALPDGSVVVRSATHDLGTGTYTVMTQVAADAIGVPVAKVRFELGDSRFPKAPGAGGSQSAASVSPAVQAAGQAMRQRLIELAIADPRSFAYRADAAQITIVEGWLRSAGAAPPGLGRPVAMRRQGASRSLRSSHATAMLSSKPVPRPSRGSSASSIRCIRSAPSSPRSGSTPTLASCACRASPLPMASARFSTPRQRAAKCSAASS